MCQIVLSIPDEVLYDTKMSHEQVNDMLPSYRTMKYKSPIWGYFHVQKE